MSKTIITCAVTGSLTRPEQSPYIPITPEQIANAAIDAAKAGAAIAHIHVRDPETGRPSMALSLYEEVVDRFRSSDTDLVINLTTGPGGRFVPSDHDPKIPAAATNLLPPEPRVDHVVRLRPEICTLDLNTMWFGDGVVMNTPRMASAMAEPIQKAGVLPELEVFDSGDIRLAKDLLKDGVLAAPPLFQMVMGTRYGFAGGAETLLYAKSQLPAAARWAAMGIGRMLLPTVALASTMGGMCALAWRIISICAKASLRRRMPPWSSAPSRFSICSAANPPRRPKRGKSLDLQRLKCSAPGLRLNIWFSGLFKVVTKICGWTCSLRQTSAVVAPLAP